jgi:integrase
VTAAGPRTHAYVVLSLCTGLRTEEARALRWEHVDFGDPDTEPSRSARRGGVAVSAGQGRHQDQKCPGGPSACRNWR